jgi:hypothetical protein
MAGQVQLWKSALARPGEGGTAGAGARALWPEFYPVLIEMVTAERVKRHFERMEIHVP